MFKVLAGLFELFVFQFIGISAFLVQEHFNIMRFLVSARTFMHACMREGGGRGGMHALRVAAGTACCMDGHGVRVRLSTRMHAVLAAFCMLRESESGWSIPFPRPASATARLLSAHACERVCPTSNVRSR